MTATVGHDHPGDAPPRVAGYISCRECGRLERAEVGHKTGGRCAPCFRAHANEILAPIVATNGSERFVLRRRLGTRLHKGDRAAQRRRWKSKPDVAERARLGARARRRAKDRLARIFPEIYEVLVADERAAAGLEAWTIEMCLTPHTSEATLQTLSTYHRRKT